MLAARTTSAQDSAQPEPALPPAPAVATGRVVTPERERERGVAGVMVTLHRVGPDSAGPLDSVRTNADGRYTLRYTRFGNAQALYFAAAAYRGIAYFSAPLRALRTRGEDAEITVFETTTARIPLSIQGHHLVVSAPHPDGMRDVVEVYELSNDTTVTLVARDSVTPVWSAPIPSAATRFVAGQGDVSSAALSRQGGRVVLSAPFGPGIKQLSYSYALPPSAFPLRVTLERQNIVLEVMLEEQDAQARSASLRAKGVATTEGRTFKRFIAQGALAGEQLRIDVPTTAASTRTRVVAGVAATTALAMLVALFLTFTRRPARPQFSPAVATADPGEALLAAIAVLDARHDAHDLTLTDVAYAEERAALKRRLGDLLAARTTSP